MSVISEVLDVFSSVGQWITGEIPTFMSLFYSADSGLTFLGALAVAGLAFSVVFLFIGFIQRFLHFSG